jgi:hypothetical protein
VGVDEVIPKFGVAMRCFKCNGKGRIAEMPLFAAREDGGKYEGLQGI